MLTEVTVRTELTELAETTEVTVLKEMTALTSWTVPVPTPRDHLSNLRILARKERRICEFCE